MESTLVRKLAALLGSAGVALTLFGNASPAAADQPWSWRCTTFKVVDANGCHCETYACQREAPFRCHINPAICPAQNTCGCS